MADPTHFIDIRPAAQSAVLVRGPMYTSLVKMRWKTVTWGVNRSDCSPFSGQCFFRAHSVILAQLIVTSEATVLNLSLTFVFHSHPHMWLPFASVGLES